MPTHSANESAPKPTPDISLGVSSWALHRALGEPPIYGPEARATVSASENPNAQMPLLEIPQLLAERGFQSIQICHFHLPTRDPAYLEELRAAIDGARLDAHALLIDAGDLTHPSNGERDAEWIADWLSVAAAIGAAEARVVAGKTGGADALSRCAQRLLGLAARAESLGVALSTENWFSPLAEPEPVLELLERCDGRVRLLLDFGNWSGADKHDKLARIAPLATSCHAKADFLEDGALNESDYLACLRLPFPEDFRGPYILVNDGWPAIDDLAAFIRDHAGSR